MCVSLSNWACVDSKKSVLDTRTHKHTSTTMVKVQGGGGVIKSRLYFYFKRIIEMPFYFLDQKYDNMIYVYSEGWLIYSYKAYL